VEIFPNSAAGQELTKRLRVTYRTNQMKMFLIKTSVLPNCQNQNMV